MFNDSGRLDVLYNNMKGRILTIQDAGESVYFTVEVDALLLYYFCNDIGKAVQK